MLFTQYEKMIAIFLGSSKGKRILEPLESVDS